MKSLVSSAVCIMLFTSYCMAQVAPLGLNPVTFTPGKSQKRGLMYSFPANGFAASNHAPDLYIKPETPAVLKPYRNTFRYTAFFCKMELKAVDYFGIWIKVHAGDYDAYTKEYYRP